MEGLIPRDDLSAYGVKRKAVSNVLRILGPLYATYVIFLVSIFLIFIPRQESQLIDQKKAAIIQLTDSAISLLNGYEIRVQKGEISLEKAMAEAADQIRYLRYGPEGKDYYWINDYHPFMVMHPYRRDLEGRDLTLFKDQMGNHPFMAMVERVMDQGAGFVNYHWQWKDAPEKVVPKTSYVKGYPAWGWIIGTGIYQEDIRREIGRITHVFLKIFTGIFVFIILLSLYITRQVFRIEKYRSMAEKARNLETLRLKRLLALSQLTGRSEKSIIRFALEEAVALTQSGMGFLASLNEKGTELTLMAVSENGETSDVLMTYTLAEAGVWAGPARNKAPLLLNGGVSDSGLEGLPLSRPEVTRLLCVPVFEGERITALAGVGDKGSDYDESDLRQLQLMMDGMWKILEKNRAEERIRESEAKYRILADNASDAIWILDLGSLRFSYVSPAMEKILGYRSKEYLGLEMGAHMTEDSLDRVSELISQELIKDGEDGVDPDRAHAVELNLIRKDGTLIWAEVSARFLRDKNGKPDRILGISRDITRRKDLEKRLREMNTDLCLAQKMAAIGNWSIDFETGERIWSDAVYEIYERDPGKGPYPFDELKSLYQGRWWEMFQTALDRAEKLGTPYDLELKLSLPSGKTKWIHTICEPEARPGSSGFFLRGTIQDVTERRRMEQRVQQTQKMEALGTLAGGIAHDFNNILSSMMGFADLARMKLKENPEIQKLLDHVLSGGLRARDLVSHILIFSRKADVERTSIQIAPLIKECLKFLRASLPPQIEIRQDLQARDLTVLADPTQMHQVLMNIFTNAAQAMKENGGILEVRLETVEIALGDECRNGELKPGPHARLVISDTGCGIPKDVIGKIFEPFFTTKARGEGTGMGLSMTYGIIREMDGAISVYSEPGTGTTFQVLIPEAEPVDAADSEAPGQPLETGMGRILLVDDEPGILSWSSEVLTRLGYEVAVAETGEGGLEQIRLNREGFDLVITDLAMPGMTGLELAGQIRTDYPNLPVVLCTGFSRGLTPEDALNYGIVEMVMKPMIASEFAKVVRRAMNKKGKEAP